jgi:hypothetical protein
MTRDELITELTILAEGNKAEQPYAASVLFVLAGALSSNMDDELAEQCAKFSRAEIVRLIAGLP